MKDLNGVEYEIGDKVAWAAVAGRSAYVRTGEVTGFTDGGSIHLKVISGGAFQTPFRGISMKACIKFPERSFIYEKVKHG